MAGSRPRIQFGTSLVADAAILSPITLISTSSMLSPFFQRCKTNKQHLCGDEGGMRVRQGGELRGLSPGFQGDVSGQQRRHILRPHAHPRFDLHLIDT